MNQAWHSPIIDHLSAVADTVTVLLAGPKSRTDIWYGILSSDTRFRVTTLAATPEDLQAKLGTHPDVVLIDASIFDGPRSLLNLVSRIQSAATYVVLPQLSPTELQSVEENLGAIEYVQAVYQVDVNLAFLIEKIYGDARTRRAIHGNNLPAWGSGGNGFKPAPVSTRIVTIWNQMGGVGKTTIASNLAMTAAQRGYPTLLIGLGAPDDLPLILGLKAQPNITNWQANPTVEGLKLSVQKVQTLDVVGGFPDVLSEAQSMNLPTDHPNSIKSLVDTAIRAGYATIMIDTPPTSLAASAMMVSNTLVIVGRPSIEGVYRTVEAYRTVAERLAGMHNIPTNQIYVTLNRVHPGHRLDADEWHRMATQSLGRAFPPVIAQIPDLVDVGDAQDQRVLPITRSDSFYRALQPLADVLFSTQGNGSHPIREGRVINLGPIKIRI